ncbi:unnamed protein product [Effrenium voratum]|nr:unnamed protein product [Effrenium voratum]
MGAASSPEYEGCGPMARRREDPRDQRTPKYSGGPGTGGWHSEGVPIETMREGDRMSGIVTNIAPFGAFVDVGAARNAKLILEPHVWRRFAVGDRIKECVVKEVELDKRRFCVTVKDAAAVLAENRIPLKDMVEGHHVDGIIDHKNPFGIWVNVGAEVIGRLNVPRKFTNHLVAGQCLTDVIIERVDLKQNKLGLTMRDPEVLMSEPVMICDLLRRKASNGHAKGQPRPSGRPKALAKGPGERKPRVGEFVDGTVVEVSSRVVMVDIGLGHLAALAVPAAIRSQFERNDEIQGMRVERVDWDEERQRGAVVLSLDDPELAESDGDRSARETPPERTPWGKWNWDDWKERKDAWKDDWRDKWRDDWKDDWKDGWKDDWRDDWKAASWWSASDW